jgi:hypothetical protein
VTTDDGIDEQRSRFRSALGRSGVDPTARAAPRLSEGTGNVIMSLAHFEQIVSPTDRMLTGRVTFRPPAVRSEGQTVVMTVEEPTVMLTRAMAVALLRSIVEALGGFEALLLDRREP